MVRILPLAIVRICLVVLLVQLHLDLFYLDALLLQVFTYHFRLLVEQFDGFGVVGLDLGVDFAIAGDEPDRYRAELLRVQLQVYARYAVVHGREHGRLHLLGRLMGQGCIAGGIAA